MDLSDLVPALLGPQGPKVGHLGHLGHLAATKGASVAILEIPKVANMAILEIPKMAKGKLSGNWKVAKIAKMAVGSADGT